MLEKIQRQNRIVEIDARNAMTGKVDDVTDWPPGSEDEKMGVDIGDTINNYYSMPSPPPTTPPPQPESRIPKLLKTAVLSAALLGSGGIGAAIPWMLGMFDNPLPPAAAVDYTDGYMEVEKWQPPGGAE